MNEDLIKTILELHLSLSRAHLKSNEVSRTHFKILHARINLLTSVILEFSAGESQKLEELKAIEKAMMNKISRVTARQETEEETFELLLAKMEELIQRMD